MKKINLGILFKERAFALRFAESLSNDFDVSLVDGKDGTDIFLTDMEDIEADIYLVWDRRLEDDTHIYAFSGISGMRKKISYAYGKLKGEAASVISAKGAKVAAVCAAGGGAGVTHFALALAEKLEGRTIYVSLEDIPYEEGGITPVDINRFMFELNENFDMASLDSVTYEGGNGVNHLRYRRPYNLINMIDVEELRKLFVKLSSSFDTVVVDMGSRISPAAEEILKLSSIVYHISREGEEGYKREEYMNLLKHIDCEIREVENFCDVAYDDEGDLFSEDKFKLRRINGSRREVNEYIEEKCEAIALNL